MAMLALGVSAVAQSADPSAVALQSAGRISGQVYSNGVLGFSIELPAKWKVDGPAEMEQTAEAGHRFLYGRDPDAAEEHARAEKVVVRLASATPTKEPSQPDPRSVQMIAVPRSRLSAEEQKSFSAATVLQNPALVGVPPSKPKYVKIAGVEFASVGSSLGTVNAAGHSIPVYLAMYATIRGENALIFGITAADEKEAAEVARTLETLRFKALAAPAP